MAGVDDTEHLSIIKDHGPVASSTPLPDETDVQWNSGERRAKGTISQEP